MNNTLYGRFQTLPLFTRTTVSACVIIYVLSAIGLINGQNLLLSAIPLWQGNYPTLVAELFTHTFIHSNLGHLIGNMLFFLAIAMGLEPAIGARKTLVVYFSGAIVAGLWLVLTTPLPTVAHPNVIPANGASAAVASLMGAALLASPRAVIFGWESFSFTIKGYLLSVPRFYVRSWLIIVMFLAQNLQALWQSGDDDIIFHAATAHIIGLVVGFLTMLWLMKRNGTTA